MALVEVKHGVHWLTFVPDGRGVDDVQDRMGGQWGEVESTWAYGHRKRMVHETGAQLYFGSAREDQPLVVNLPGEVCEGHADQGLAWSRDMGARVTRVDLAADVGPEDQARARIKQMIAGWKRGKVETSMRRTSHSLVKSDRPGEGWTAYFGGRQADAQLRVYDRRGPLRLEWQWRPSKVDQVQVAGRIADRGSAFVWRGLARSAVWSMPWYRELLAGDATEITPDIEAETAFAKAVEAAREQLGASLWALQLAGITLDDLAVDPGPGLRGDVAAKFLRWADEAEGMGYDGTALRREVRCRLKAKPEHGSPRRGNPK